MNLSPPERVLIVGGGAQAQSAADVLLFLAESGWPVAVVGFVDDNPALWGTQWMGLPVLGPIAAVAEIGHDALFIGIGNNRTRKRLYNAFAAQGERFATVRHPSAVLGRGGSVGPGTYIGPCAVVGVETHIGANVILNGGGVLGHHNVIGDHAHIAPGVDTTGAVRIGVGALVGAGAAIIPGRTVGAWSVVGAGAVVTCDVPDGATVAGVPARSRQPETSFA
jgi:sugar O-acyltransferase (sialic acid O-acetyltransferase NeuD family)